MNTKTRNLLFVAIFVVCMLAVALLLIFTQPGNEDEDEESQTTADTTIALFDGRSEDVASINVKNESGEFTISQDAKGFHIDELDGLDQNETTLKAIANIATSMKAQTLAEEDAEDLSKYGLEEGEEVATSVVNLKDGSSYTIHYGIDAPDGLSKYIRIDDSRDVYVVLTNSAGYFYSPKESYISLIVQQGIASESVAPTIDHMVITRKDLDYDIEFIDDSKKYSADEVSMASSQVMISPVYAYLDIVNSNSIIYGLWGLTAVEAVKAFPTEEDMEEYGLADPFCSVVINAELQTYDLKIGNVESYVLDEDGNETTEPAYFYGYYEGVDVIFLFSSESVPWATFQPIDILSSLVTSNYVMRLDYIDVQLHNTEDINYYFDVTGDLDTGELSVTLDGEPKDTEDFKLMYQFMLKCPIDDICLEDPPADAKLLARIEYVLDGGGGDVVEYYDGGANTVIIKLNGTTSFSQPKSYLDVLESNLALFASGASGEELQMML